MIHAVNRRTFLKGAAAGALGLGLAALGGAYAQSGRRDLTIGINAQISTFDPHHTAASIVGSRYYGLIFDQLTQIDAQGRLGPMLATHWSAEGDVWRFRLREGVVFHDGSTLTADDVVFSLERLLFSPNESPIRATFTPYLDGVRAVGPLEIEVRTTRLDPLLPRRLATPWAAIMPRAAVEATGFDAVQTAPIAAGPYRLVEYRDGDRVVLEPHDAYWGGVPPLGQVTLRLIPENATRIAALQAGEVDMVTTVPPDLLDQIARSTALRVDDVLLFNYMHIYFNTVAGLTANVDVRRALSLGIDRQLIADALWGGRVRVLNDYYLPGEFGHDPARPAFAYDPDAAARALGDAGYAGEALRFTPPATYYTNGRLVTDAITEMWQAIGVNVDYEPLELAGWAERSLTGQQVATLQSFGTSGDPGANSFVTEYAGGNWLSQYYPASDEFKALAREASSSLDEAVRYRNYRAIADILDRDVPFAPMYQSTEFYGVRAGIRWQPHPNFYLDLRPGQFAWEG
jgi:peptide/nickel transport system substrate-binding protein